MAIQYLPQSYVTTLIKENYSADQDVLPSDILGPGCSNYYVVWYVLEVVALLSHECATRTASVTIINLVTITSCVSLSWLLDYNVIST